MARPLQSPVTATFDAAEPWRVNLGAAFQDLVPGGVDNEPTPRGSLSGVRLGPVGMFTVSGTPQVVQRTTSAVRRSPGDLIKVCVQLHGRATVQQGSHEVALGPGDLAAADAAMTCARMSSGSCARTWTILGCPGPASPRRITCRRARSTGCSPASRGRSAA
jgi:hypothetical protein